MQHVVVVLKRMQRIRSISQPDTCVDFSWIPYLCVPDDDGVVVAERTNAPQPSPKRLISCLEISMHTSCTKLCVYLLRAWGVGCRNGAHHNLKMRN